MLLSGIDHLILPPMGSREVVVRGEAGLHARPAAPFCLAAGRLRAEVRVHKAGAAAGAKSPPSVLQLDVRQGDKIVLVAEGAVEALAELPAGG